MPEENLQLYYAPEVEEALVTLLWHRPDFIPWTCRTLNPGFHISSPALRHLLGAILICYSEMGVTDWATVVDCLRDQKLLAECGGLLELDRLYSHPGYEALLDYYVRLLQEYATHRKAFPGIPPSHWAGGSATLLPNHAKRKETDPDFIAATRIGGKVFTICGWSEPIKGCLKLRFYPGVSSHG